MAVKRIVANIAAAQVEPATRFHGEVFGMDLIMDLSWIVTYVAGFRGPADQHGNRGRFRNLVPDSSIGGGTISTRFATGPSPPDSRSSMGPLETLGACPGSTCAIHSAV